MYCWPNARVGPSRRPRVSSRTTTTRSGNTTTRTGEHATGSRTVSQTGEGYNVNKTVQTDSGASKTVNKDVNVEDREVERTSTATNKWGQSATREREIEGQGGYATIEGSASTSGGREASADLVAGRTYYGQPAVAGSVNTKYNGNYNVAAGRTPYGGWNTAVAGPYGGRVTTTLPSGYRTSTYYGRPYYSYGGAYYRPYTYHGVHHYYPVPVPYYAYYSTPPVGAMIVTMAAVTYLVTKEGNYAKQTTTSNGTVQYQSVPAPTGAKIATLPVERVLVTVSGTTYYLHGNTFYRRVVTSGQEQFVAVTAPAGVVMIGALPADFEVEQLNTMYFVAGSKYYVPILTPEGKELYVMVDRPAQPQGAAATAAKSPAPAPAPRQGPGRRRCCGTRARRGRDDPGADGHAARRAVGRRRQLRHRCRGQSLPGVPRPGSRRQRPDDRAQGHPGVRRRLGGRQGQQGQRPAGAHRGAVRHQGRRPRALDQDAADHREGPGRQGRPQGRRRRGHRRGHRRHCQWR